MEYVRCFCNRSPAALNALSTSVISELRMSKKKELAPLNIISRFFFFLFFLFFPRQVGSLRYKMLVPYPANVVSVTFKYAFLFQYHSCCTVNGFLDNDILIRLIKLLNGISPTTIPISRRPTVPPSHRPTTQLCHGSQTRRNCVLRHHRHHPHCRCRCCTLKGHSRGRRNDDHDQPVVAQDQAAGRCFLYQRRAQRPIPAGGKAGLHSIHPRRNQTHLTTALRRSCSNLYAGENQR